MEATMDSLSETMWIIPTFTCIPMPEPSPNYTPGDGPIIINYDPNVPALRVRRPREYHRQRMPTASQGNHIISASSLDSAAAQQNRNPNNNNIYGRSESVNSTFHQININDALKSHQTISHYAPVDSGIHAVLNFAAAEELAVELGLPITAQEDYMYIDPQSMNTIDKDDRILAAHLDRDLATRFTGRLGNGALHRR